jgi:hypothetical protein
LNELPDVCLLSALEIVHAEEMLTFLEKYSKLTHSSIYLYEGENSENAARGPLFNTLRIDEFAYAPGRQPHIVNTMTKLVQSSGIGRRF